MILICFLNGGETPFPIETAEHWSVGTLKKAIKHEMRDTLSNIAAHRLALYQVSTAGEAASIKAAFEAIVKNPMLPEAVTQGLKPPLKLVPSLQLSHYFSTPPEECKIHILIRISPVTPFIGPRGADPSKIVLGDERNKRPRGNGETEFGDDQPPPKEKEKRTLHPNEEGKLNLLKSISSLHEIIKSSTLDLDDLSDPSKMNHIPWPSPLGPPLDRFETRGSKNHPTTIEYMGRSIFEEVWKDATGDGFKTKFNELYLYGPSGVGKSHLLAALVFSLVQRGERVVYIPDCYMAVKNPYTSLLAALLFAFHGVSNLQRAIVQARTLDDLIGVMQFQPQLSFYLIVDQCNALEVEHEKDLGAARKAALENALANISFHQKYIFSATADAKANRDADKKQTGIKVFYLNAGMSRDETEGWFQYHAPDFPSEHRGFVEDVTGCVPLLLHSLSGFKIENGFDEAAFLTCKELKTVKEDILAFYENIFSNRKFKLCHDQCMEIMSACILGHSIEGDNKDLYDLRYFYSDERGKAQYTCGMARQTLISVYRRQIPPGKVISQHDSQITKFQCPRLPDLI